MDIKHKHAGRILIIEGHTFTADGHGHWSLTDIWRALGLPVSRSPGAWLLRSKPASYRAAGRVITKRSMGTTATMQATIAYADWVSPGFSDLLYEAIEAAHDASAKVTQ